MTLLFSYFNPRYASHITPRGISALPGPVVNLDSKLTLKIQRKTHAAAARADCQGCALFGVVIISNAH